MQMRKPISTRHLRTNHLCDHRDHKLRRKSNVVLDQREQCLCLDCLVDKVNSSGVHRVDTTKHEMSDCRTHIGKLDVDVLDKILMVKFKEPRPLLHREASDEQTVGCSFDDDVVPERNKSRGEIERR
jgi:hypothetical protein